jgi:hypothetical protein
LSTIIGGAYVNVFAFLMLFSFIAFPFDIIIKID